jgi:hypothetical protein
MTASIGLPRLFGASILIFAALLFSPQLALAQFTQQGPKLVGTGAVGQLVEQGFSVALSADGNTAVVGGLNDNGGAGAVWVFTRSNGVWTQQGNKLVGTGAVGTARQGFSVALSADGNTALVGGLGDNSFAGAVWVFTRSDGVWTQQGNKLVGTGAVGTADQGVSLALSADGNTALVSGVGDNSLAGAVWVFTRSNGVWTQQGNKLVGTGAVGTARQGFSVALSADGNSALVGGRGDNGDAGAVWVFTRSNGVWTQQGNKLVGTGAVGTAEQGALVALSADGNTALVGGPGDNGDGAVWVFTRSNGVWTQQGNKLVGTGAVGIAEQGWSVALSADGNTAVVGGLSDNGGDGAAWVFVQPTTVPFSAFTAQLTVYPNQPGFSIDSNFTLGNTINGINPPAEPVTLQIGSFTITIPTGSFVKAGPGYFTFVGVINNVSLNVLIRLTSGNNYIFGVIAKNVSLTIQNPVSVTLTIGDDSRTTSVNANTG